MQKEREFHIILWGATSFVGQIIAQYLLHRLGSDGSTRWALAARNEQKLEDLKQRMGPEAASLPTLIGDSFDPDFLKSLTSRTRVVLTTVGPYQKYGEPLVEACVLNGTDYCDLTGEVSFVQAMMDKYGEQASRSGARLVNCSGFDSLPSDLGVLYLNDHAQKAVESSVETIEMQVRKAKGGVSGGTIASAVETVSEVRKNPNLRKVLQNPYAICPADKRSGVRQPSLFGAKKSDFTGHWLHHFVMAPVNTKVVHASNAHMNYPYGEDFEYTEWQVTENGWKAHLANIATNVAMLALYFPWTRALLTSFLPKPGEGPSPEAQQSGFFELHFHGRTRNKRVVGARVTGDSDPGYGSTAKQISEVALELARTFPEERNWGGFRTPASSLGLSLIKPLTEHAGLTFEAWTLDGEKA